MWMILNDVDEVLRTQAAKLEPLLLICLNLFLHIIQNHPHRLNCMVLIIFVSPNDANGFYYVSEVLSAQTQILDPIY